MVGQGVESTRNIPMETDVDIRFRFLFRVVLVLNTDLLFGWFRRKVLT